VAAGAQPDSGRDILALATPTWMGHMSSVASRTIERLNAEQSETDEQGRPLMFGKVALTVVVGNEDGATRSPLISSKVSTTSGSPCPRKAASTGTARP
jgi:multimeric flavodoxin WrbA